MMRHGPDPDPNKLIKVSIEGEVDAKLLRARHWGRISFQHFALLALVFAAIPSLDGETANPEAGHGLLRTLGALYVIAGALLLLTQTGKLVKWRLFNAVAWSTLGGGSLFFVTVSPVPAFWAATACGAFWAASRAWRGIDNCV